MNYTVISYSIYIIISVVLTIWVAKTLSKNGKIFIVDILNGNEELAESLNKLLVVGFYLVNIGYAVMNLTIHQNINSTEVLIEQLSLKLGIIILLLGGMHFFNLLVLINLRKKSKTPKKVQL